MKLRKLGKKGQTISPLVAGVGALVLLIIVTFILVSTLSEANLLEDARSSTIFNDETTSTVVNETGSSFGNSTQPDARCTIVTAMNGSTNLIPTSNYSVSGCTVTYIGKLGSGFNNTAWQINSTTTYDGEEEVATSNLRVNLSTGVNNVSEKVPTIFKVAAVVLLITILVFLFRKAQPIIGSGNGSL